MIASDTSCDGTYYVPAQLLSHEKVLYAFVGRMKGGNDLIKTCEVYVLDEATSRWNRRGEIADLFLPNCRPIKMADGNWIMAGRAASHFGVKPIIPAVAISKGDNLTGRWTVVPLPEEALQEEEKQHTYPETTVWIEGSNVVALTRSKNLLPFLYESKDYGRTWSVPSAFEGRNGKRLHAADSKLYAGHLSTGERYVVYSEATKDEEGRTCERGALMIRISRAGKIEEYCTPEKIWRVQDLNDPAVPAPPGVKAFRYPSAVEYEGRLFVIYTVGDTPPRQCELAIIPIASLQLKDPHKK